MAEKKKSNANPGRELDDSEIIAISDSELDTILDSADITDTPIADIKVEYSLPPSLPPAAPSAKPPAPEPEPEKESSGFFDESDEDESITLEDSGIESDELEDLSSLTIVETVPFQNESGSEESIIDEGSVQSGETELFGVDRHETADDSSAPEDDDDEDTFVILSDKVYPEDDNSAREFGLGDDEVITEEDFIAGGGMPELEIARDQADRSEEGREAADESIVEISGRSLDTLFEEGGDEAEAADEGAFGSQPSNEDIAGVEPLSDEDISAAGTLSGGDFADIEPLPDEVSLSDEEISAAKPLSDEISLSDEEISTAEPLSDEVSLPGEEVSAAEPISDEISLSDEEISDAEPISDEVSLPGEEVSAAEPISDEVSLSDEEISAAEARSAGESLSGEDISAVEPLPGEDISAVEPLPGEEIVSAEEPAVGKDAGGPEPIAAPPAPTAAADDELDSYIIDDQLASPVEAPSEEIQSAGTLEDVDDIIDLQPPEGFTLGEEEVGFAEDDIFLAPAEELLMDAPPASPFDFGNAPLDDSMLKDAPLDDSMLKDAPLDDSMLQDAPLDDSMLQDAPLDDAALADAPLDDTSLGDASLDDAIIDGEIILSGPDEETLKAFAPESGEPEEETPEALAPDAISEMRDEVVDEEAPELQVLDEPEAQDTIPAAAEDEDSADDKDAGVSPGNALLRDDMRKVLGYLDNLFDELPQERVKEFANSEYYEMYNRLFKELGL